MLGGVRVIVPDPEGRLRDPALRRPPARSDVGPLDPLPLANGMKAEAWALSAVMEDLTEARKRTGRSFVAKREAPAVTTSATFPPLPTPDALRGEIIAKVGQAQRGVEEALLRKGAARGEDGHLFLPTGGSSRTAAASATIPSWLIASGRQGAGGQTERGPTAKPSGEIPDG